MTETVLSVEVRNNLISCEGRFERTVVFHLCSQCSVNVTSVKCLSQNKNVPLRMMFASFVIPANKKRNVWGYSNEKDHERIYRDAKRCNKNKDGGRRYGEWIIPPWSHHIHNMPFPQWCSAFCTEHCHEIFIFVAWNYVLEKRVIS